MRDDNGSIEGGAAGFAVDDEVFVQMKTDRSEVRVIGHTDGVRSCYWEPWSGPKLTSKHSWSEYVNAPNIHPWQVQDGLLLHDLTCTFTGDIEDILEWRSEYEEDNPYILIPEKKLFLNISSFLSKEATGSYNFGVFQVLDEFWKWKEFFFAGSATVQATYPNYLDQPSAPSVWLGNNDGINPLSLEPLLGRIMGVFYAANWEFGFRLQYQSDFIDFR